MKFSRNMFERPMNALEGFRDRLRKPNITLDQCVRCSVCGRVLFGSELEGSLNVCPKCGTHFKIGARERLLALSDKGAFAELDAELIATNRLDFPGYDEKLKKARAESGENESVVTGLTRVSAMGCAVFAMETRFIMASMGCVTGEKLTRLFEKAKALRLPVIGFCASGGARVHEGILSLMQMAKVSAAVKAHSDAGLLYIAVLQNPTTGGVTASFAMQGDIIIAEPKALIGFAGPRVIQQTIRRELPEGFQTAEFVRDKGFVDMIVPRNEQQSVLTELLRMHGGAK